MVQLNENIVGIDSAIFMHPKTWIASGHVDAFNDPLIDNKDSKKRYRADVLIEDHIEKLNTKILKEKIFDNIWIQPAAGDAGGSLGAALALWHLDQGNERKINSNDDMNGSYLGPEFTQSQIEEELKSIGGI